MRLICDDPRGYRIGGKPISKGDEFEISDREGGLLIMLGKAKPYEPKENSNAKRKAKKRKDA